MFPVFTKTPHAESYQALANRIPLDEMNPVDEPDVAPESLLNQAIWHSVKVAQVPYPTSRQSTR